ncbi:hypothetical protein Trydic_g19208 [Trypoxylus dichotomus]
MTTSSESVRFSGPNFDETLMKCYEDVESKVNDIGGVSECDIESEHDTESDVDTSEDAEMDTKAVNTKMESTKAQHCIFTWPYMKGKNSVAPIQIWKCLLSNNILGQVLKYKNEKLLQMREKYIRSDKGELHSVLLNDNDLEEERHIADI